MKICLKRVGVLNFSLPYSNAFMKSYCQNKSYFEKSFRIFSQRLDQYLGLIKGR